MDSHDVRRQWAERSGEYSPGYYAYYGPDEKSEAVESLLDGVVGRDGRILEVGCSSGRHLAHLNERGYERLHGVEINAAALEVMRENFPELADDGTFHLEAVEDVVGEFEDGAFDAVFSVETLQHIHPDDAGVFAELARVTDQLLVTVENEGDPAEGDAGDRDVTYVDDDVPLYHRDWNRVFTGLGLEEIESRSMDSNTLRGFRQADCRR